MAKRLAYYGFRNTSNTVYALGCNPKKWAHASKLVKSPW